MAISAEVWLSVVQLNDGEDSVGVTTLNGTFKESHLRLLSHLHTARSTRSPAILLFLSSTASADGAVYAYS